LKRTSPFARTASAVKKTDGIQRLSGGQCAGKTASKLNYLENLLQCSYMIKQQFYFFMIGTVLYAWFFSDALFSNHPFLTGFWGFMLIRKLRIAYRADCWIRLNKKN
jgi:hypothetical protein